MQLHDSTIGIIQSMHECSVLPKINLNPNGICQKIQYQTNFWNLLFSSTIFKTNLVWLKMVHINKNGKIIHIADENGHGYWSYPSSSIARSLSLGYDYHSGNCNSSLQKLYQKAIKTFIFKKHLKKQKCLLLKP